MKRVRQLAEAEAIGEFLKNEFYEPEYNRDRDRFESIVWNPDFTLATENAVRRALLFRRRGPMWRELPPDTTWWEMEMDATDLPRLQVFPRAHWRKMSNGSLRIGDVVRRIRECGYRAGGEQVIAKIQQMRYRLQHDEKLHSSVLLIGVDEAHSLTIFEGNHRLSAAMLVGPQVASSRFRFLAGFSPRMTGCWFYRTDMPNFFRYVQNRLLHLYDVEADVDRVLPAVARPAVAAVSKKLSESQS